MPVTQSEAVVQQVAAPSRQFMGLSWSAWAGVLLFLAAGAMIASMFQFFR
jgi:hypothetical protein